MGGYALASWQRKQLGPCLCQRKRVGGGMSLGHGSYLSGMAQLALLCPASHDPGSPCSSAPVSLSPCCFSLIPDELNLL